MRRSRGGPSPLDTELLFRRPTSSSGFVSSAGLPLLTFQERYWPRPGRCSWPLCLRLLRRNASSRCSQLCCPSVPSPGGSAAPDQAAEPAVLTSAVPAPHLHPPVPKGSSPPRLPKDLSPPRPQCHHCCCYCARCAASRLL